MNSKKILPILLLVVVVALGAYYLSDFEETPDEIEDKELLVGTTDTATTLDPADAYDYFSSAILYNSLDTLVGYEPGTDELEGKVATDWSIDEGGEVYSFELRDDVYFQNGEHLTAEDVKFSLERARDLEGMPSSLVAGIDEVIVLDDYELEIHLESPSIPFLSKLAYTVAGIVPKEDYPDEDFRNESVIGSGPYEVSEWVPGEKVVFEENEYYWGDSPEAERVEIEIFDSSEELKTAVDNGEIDLAYRTIKPAHMNDLRLSEYVDTKTFESPEIRYIVMDAMKEPFDDLNARRGVAYAIDREQIVEEVYLDERYPLYSMVPSEMWSHRPVFEDEYGTYQDIESAREELETAGYSEDEPMEITLWYTPSHYGDLEVDLAHKLEEQLEMTDMIDVTVESEVWEQFTGRMGEDFKIHLLGWYPDFYDPDNYLSPFLQSQASGFIGSHYADDEMDQMLAEQRQIIDHDDRTDKFVQIQEKLAEEAPYVPLVQGEQFAAFSPEIEYDSVKLGPVQIFRYYTISKEDW